MKLQRAVTALAMASALFVPSLAGAQPKPKPCDIDATPAATLLIPYFEVVPLADPVPGSTLVALVNAQSATRIAHVTLWTDWAIPTANFDVVLTANDVYTFDVVNLFRQPIELQPEIPGCRGNLRPGTLHMNAALRPGPSLDEKLSRLREAHSGAVMALPTGNFVASSTHPDDPMVGYITVDVVTKCNALFPSTASYFDPKTRVASDENALLGDVIWTDYTRGIAYGEPAVHLRAHPTAFGKEITFYWRYVDGKGWDHRQPLGRHYAHRYLLGPLGNMPVATNLLIWRDTRSKFARPVAVGTTPPWLPLTRISFSDWDEEENRGPGDLAAEATSLATQRVDITDPLIYTQFAPFGWMKWDLGHQQSARFKQDGQAWITFLAKAANFPITAEQAGMGLRAWSLQSRCK